MKRKILILITALVAMVLVLGACASVKEIKSTEEEARVVGTCGEYKVRYELLRYYTMQAKLQMESLYGEEIFESEASAAPYEDELEALVFEQIERSYAMVELFDEADIGISDKTAKKDLDAYMEVAVEEIGGTEAYVAHLAETYQTDWVFRLNASILNSQYRYYDFLEAERDKEAYDAVMAQDGFIRCMSIFLQNDPGESVAENRAAAKMVHDDIASGKSTLEDYIGTKYNQDTSSCDYYFMRGYFIEEYEDAAFALEVGELSEVVETPEGFYIIQRMETEDWYFDENLDTLKVMYHVCSIENDTNRIAETLSVELNEFGQSISLWAMQ